MSKITRSIALLAQALTVGATILCLIGFSYAFVLPDRRINWIPIVYFICMNALCLYGVWLAWMRPPSHILRRSIWVALGLWLGFIVAGSWSIGLYFVPGWLVMTSLAFVEARRDRTPLLLILTLIVLMIGLAVAQTAYLIFAPRIFFN
jgi:hypothetical protein